MSSACRRKTSRRLWALGVRRCQARPAAHYLLWLPRGYGSSRSARLEQSLFLVLWQIMDLHMTMNLRAKPFFHSYRVCIKYRRINSFCWYYPDSCSCCSFSLWGFITQPHPVHSQRLHFLFYLRQCQVHSPVRAEEEELLSHHVKWEYALPWQFSVAGFSPSSLL